MQNYPALERLLRLKDIIAPDGPIPISRSSWWSRMRNDPDWPQPVKLGPRTTAWRAQDIADLISRLAKDNRDQEGL